MKKLNFIIISIFLFLNSISFTQNNKNDSDASTYPYNCQKVSTKIIPVQDNNFILLVRADTKTSKKQSATEKSSKNNSSKKQSTTQKLCSSVTNILNNEIDKTKNKTKLGILKGGLKYTNEICGKGGTPDLNKVTEGLPEQDRIRISQKTNAALFDGVDPNLKQENLTNISGTLPSLTGKDGKITDFKSYDPTLPAASSNPVPKLETTKAANNPDNTVRQYPSEDFDYAVEALGRAIELSTECIKSAQEYKKEIEQKCDQPLKELDKSMQESPAKMDECLELYRKCDRPASKTLSDEREGCSRLKEDTKEDEQRKKNCYEKAQAKYETAHQECLTIQQRCIDEYQQGVKKLQQESLDLQQKCNNLVQEKYTLVGKCAEEKPKKICPTKCKCEGDYCDDINSLVCLNACESDSLKKKICLPQRAFCPKGWDDTIWGKTRELGPEIEVTRFKIKTKVNLDSLTGHGVKGKIVSLLYPAASKLLKYAAEGVPEKEQEDGKLIIDNEHNKNIVDKILKSKGYEKFRDDYDAGKPEEELDMTIEKSDNKDLYYALHKVEYVDKVIDKKNNKIKFYFEDTYNFEKPKESDSDLLKAGWWWQDNKWITPYEIKIVIEDEYEKKKKKQ